MATLASVIQRGTIAAQPAATTVSVGTLYCQTDSSPANQVQRSNGTTWDNFVPTGGGDVTHTGTLAANALVIGNGGADVSTTTTGTGILTALGINTGSAGAPVLFNGALGTPSSGTLTNCTGLPTTGLGAGGVVQVVNTTYTTTSTGTTTIPVDDTIPQKTEGNEYFTLAITPTNTNNKLRIDVVIAIAHSTPGCWMFAGIWQDAANDALAGQFAYTRDGTGVTNGAPNLLTFTHYMTAGTTSATTFKVRAGGTAAGTTTVNGSGGARLYGGVITSSITITEIKV